MLKDGERLEPLGGGVRVIVSNEHRFTTDTVLLAHFSALKKNETAVELGSGCGAIPLLWNKTGAPKHIDAVELQSDAADMLTRSVALNGFEETISVFQKDLRCLKGTLPFGVYDLEACNPPYKMLGSGLQNPREAHRLARHECACTLEDTALAAARLLRFGGRFCMCQRPERLCDIMNTLRKANLEPKRLRMVQQRAGKAPKLVLIEARRGARPGGLVVEPALMIEDNTGGFSQEMLAVYGDYKCECL